MARLDVIKAPENWLNASEANQRTIFLAGSIDMGKAVDWQTEITEKIREKIKDKHSRCTIFNPRRDDWDSSWKQDINFQPFREQVEWELSALDYVDTIVYVFDPKGQAPITLLELGLHAKNMYKKKAVVCPRGYWRKGNVDIVCKKYGIPMFNSIDDLLDKWLIPTWDDSTMFFSLQEIKKSV